MLFLFRRGTMFFLLMECLTVFLYAVGILRQFTASTQFMLLRMGAFFGLALGITGVMGIGMDLIILVRDRHLHSRSKLVFVALACFTGFAAAASAVLILAFTGGNLS
ncbi:MAG: hypothetical protein LBC88_00215 [Spirochaetaceae bacterium]|jgi:hypothetical protein|nr:hypothetical protein [Spirochaetaceae bacterium]